MPCQKALKPAVKRELVDKLISAWGTSVSRACRVLRVDRPLYLYKPRRDEQAELKQQIKETAQTRVRYGYRIINVLLVREDWGGRLNFSRPGKPTDNSFIESL